MGRLSVLSGILCLGLALAADDFELPEPAHIFANGTTQVMRSTTPASESSTELSNTSATSSTESTPPSSSSSPTTTITTTTPTSALSSSSATSEKSSSPPTSKVSSPPTPQTTSSSPTLPSSVMAISAEDITTVNAAASTLTANQTEKPSSPSPTTTTAPSSSTSDSTTTDGAPNAMPSISLQALMAAIQAQNGSTVQIDLSKLLAPNLQMQISSLSPSSSSSLPATTPTASTTAASSTTTSASTSVTATSSSAKPNSPQPTTTPFNEDEDDYESLRQGLIRMSVPVSVEENLIEEVAGPRTTIRTTSRSSPAVETPTPTATTTQSSSSTIALPDYDVNPDQVKEAPKVSVEEDDELPNTEIMPFPALSELALESRSPKAQTMPHPKLQQPTAPQPEPSQRTIPMSPPTPAPQLAPSVSDSEKPAPVLVDASSWQGSESSKTLQPGKIENSQKPLLDSSVETPSEYDIELVDEVNDVDFNLVNKPNDLKVSKKPKHVKIAKHLGVSKSAPSTVTSKALDATNSIMNRQVSTFVSRPQSSPKAQVEPALLELENMLNAGHSKGDLSNLMDPAVLDAATAAKKSRLDAELSEAQQRLPISSSQNVTSGEQELLRFLDRTPVDIFAVQKAALSKQPVQLAARTQNLPTHNQLNFPDNDLLRRNTEIPMKMRHIGGFAQNSKRLDFRRLRRRGNYKRRKSHLKFKRNHKKIRRSKKRLSKHRYHQKKKSRKAYANDVRTETVNKNERRVIVDGEAGDDPLITALKKEQLEKMETFADQINDIRMAPRDPSYRPQSELGPRPHFPKNVDEESLNDLRPIGADSRKKTMIDVLQDAINTVFSPEFDVPPRHSFSAPAKPQVIQQEKLEAIPDTQAHWKNGKAPPSGLDIKKILMTMAPPVGPPRSTSNGHVAFSQISMVRQRGTTTPEPELLPEDTLIDGKSPIELEMEELTASLAKLNALDAAEVRKKREKINVLTTDRDEPVYVDAGFK